MKFTLKIESEDQAMTDYPIEEMTEILNDLANQLNNGSGSGKIHDSNGNSIGEWEYTED